MTNKTDWNNLAKETIKSWLDKKGIDYKELSKKLEAIGIEETNNNLSTKINRGTFNFPFVLQIAQAINSKSLPINIDYINNSDSEFSKNDYIEAFWKLFNIHNKANNEIDALGQKIDDIYELLHFKIGLHKELIEDLANYDFDCSIYNENLTKEIIGEHYDYLINKNKSMTQLINLEKEILGD